MISQFINEYTPVLSVISVFIPAMVVTCILYDVTPGLKGKKSKLSLVK